MSSSQGKNARIHYPFWFGGSASCFAACVTHPLDLREFQWLVNLPIDCADLE
jgi:hypothetical protein